MDFESAFIAVGICLMTLWGATIVTDFFKSEPTFHHSHVEGASTDGSETDEESLENDLDTNPFIEVDNAEVVNPDDDVDDKFDSDVYHELDDEAYDKAETDMDDLTEEVKQTDHELDEVDVGI